MKRNIVLIILLALLVASIIANIFFYVDKSKLSTKVKGAESLYNLNFTKAKRDSLLDGVTEAIEKYKAIQEFDIPNHLAPAFIFSPVPLNYKQIGRASCWERV